MPLFQQITDSELEIMQLIWESGGDIFLGPLMDTLAVRGRSWKPNTVLTFLTRLVEKGMLRIEKQGRLNQYIATCTEKEYQEKLAQSFVDKIYGGNAKGLVAALLRRDKLSRQDMDELQDFWKEAKEQHE